MLPHPALIACSFCFSVLQKEKKRQLKKGTAEIILHNIAYCPIKGAKGNLEAESQKSLKVSKCVPITSSKRHKNKPSRVVFPKSVSQLLLRDGSNLSEGGGR